MSISYTCYASIVAAHKWKCSRIYRRNRSFFPIHTITTGNRRSTRMVQCAMVTGGPSSAWCGATIRVGTLDHAERFAPQAHVFVSSKQPWVQIPEGVPQFPVFYELEEVWSAESLGRRRAIQPQIEAWRSSRAKMQ